MALLARVGRDPHRGLGAVPGDDLDHDARQEEVDVLEAGRGNGAAEDVCEEHDQHHRLHGRQQHELRLPHPVPQAPARQRERVRRGPPERPHGRR